MDKSMMQRRHYEAIAKAVRLALIDDAQIGDRLDGPMEGVTRVAKRLADTLEKDNPGFLRSRFMKACGLPETT